MLRDSRPFLSRLLLRHADSNAPGTFMSDHNCLANSLFYLETLQRIASGMGPQRGFQASLQFLLAQLAERHGFLRPHLVIFDPETRTLRLCVADGAPRAGQVVYEPGMGVTGQVFVSGKPVIVEQLKNHPVFLSKFFERSEAELSSLAFLSVPVLAPQTGGEDAPAHKVIGVLSVDTPCAPLEELTGYRAFLEVIASMIATQAAYLQDDMARQQRIAERSGKQLEIADGLDSGLIARSASMREVLRNIGLAGNSRGPVLLSGEHGTGKARLAALIHAASPRHDLPLVRFYSVPEAGQSSDEAISRELFGYKKGAFPGALQTRKGLFELAHCSTLFLDNIERLSLPIQEGILHVLQTQSVNRAGGGQPVSVDVRLICSTTEDLHDMTRQGLFLEDLLNRIASFVIEVPPLRERPDDIIPLAEHFLKAAAEHEGHTIERISTPARERLLHHVWPGNIRELMQVMEKAAHLCDDTVLRAAHLPLELQTEEEGVPLPFNDAVARFEQELLVDALQRAHGNMLQAARDLQVTYRIVNYKIKKYGIDPHEYL